jgi:hypothetical protein
MSRTAASTLGLILVALSIGFNTMRYPVVWEMAGPAQANEPAQTAAASPSEKADDVAQVRPPQPASQTEPSPAGQAESKPNSDLVDRMAADRSASGETNAPSNAERDANAGSFDKPETQRPLVPVTSLGGTELAAGVRRLPPVDRVNSGRMGRSAGSISGGSFPVYPSTGI